MQAAQMRHMRRVLRLKRVQHALIRPGGVHPALNPKFGDRLLKTEPGRDHPDRADDRAGISVYFITGQSDPIPAGRRDILAKHKDRNFLFTGELPDTLLDQVGLHRRAARRIDHQGHRLGPPAGERRLQPRGQRLQIEATP